MKYDLYSDLHVDVNNGKVDPLDFSILKSSGARVAVVAGDIGNFLETTIDYITGISCHYEYVVFTDGNHDHYDYKYTGNTVDMNMNILRNHKWINNNVTYLDGINSLQVDDTLFIGANGWYDFKFIPAQYNSLMSIKMWEEQSNDSVLISFDSSPQIYALEQATSLAKQVENAQNDDSISSIVVVTHTVPTSRGITIKNEYVWDLLSGAYGNTCMEKVWNADVNKKIKHSVFGHTHLSYDFDDFGIRFIANPRGYHGWDGDITNWAPVLLEL